MTAQVKEQIRVSDEVIDELIYLLEASRDYQFAVGDRLISLVGKNDANRTEVINYVASQLNINASKLHEYYRVATRWSPEYREIYQSLDWTIYRNSDPNDPDDRELLDKCIDEGWNSTTFKEEKYPAIKDPANVAERLLSIATRNKKRFEGAALAELEGIISRLERLLNELEKI